LVASLASFLTIGLAAALPVLDRRGSPERLIVFAAVAVLALSLSGVGIVAAVRGFRLARGDRGARAVAVVLALLASATGAGWLIGAVNVLFFGA
jgi:hypothetical protein